MPTEFIKLKKNITILNEKETMAKTSIDQYTDIAHLIIPNIKSPKKLLISNLKPHSKLFL